MESDQTRSAKETVDVELDCALYQFSGGSIGDSNGDAVFCCTISPVPEEVLERLTAAAEARGRLRLLFSDRPLLLERLEVQRHAPGSARIVGRVVK